MTPQLAKEIGSMMPCLCTDPFAETFAANTLVDSTDSKSLVDATRGLQRLIGAFRKKSSTGFSKFGSKLSEEHHLRFSLLPLFGFFRNWCEKPELQGLAGCRDVAG
jgi:hypothetical protein